MLLASNNYTIVKKNSIRTAQGAVWIKLMSLPLRLKVEIPVRAVCGVCFVLPSSDESKVCFVVNDHGLIALACSECFSADEISRITNISSSDLPDYFLCQVGDSNDFQWWKCGSKCVSAPNQRDIACTSKSLHATVARTILESIERYYSRQVLEPSIRGFLAILEKQFPRNDLYLFELLQNAVDDGANNINMTSLKSIGTAGGGGQGGIHFCHNGRGFTPLDVLGLASVGLSTKGSSTDEKRKIGFMGVGFKAVYKRFARVTVFDHVWKFRFVEPATTPAMEPTHSWVLKPSWDPSPSANLCADVPGSEQWCHFVLERPRGGAASVRTDMAGLPETCPVLLGRQALKVRRADALAGGSTGNNSEQTAPWRLKWEDREYLVRNAGAGGLKAIPASGCLFDRVAGTGLAEDRAVQCSNASGGTWTFCYGDKVRVGVGSLSTGGVAQHWQFLTVCFHPSADAKRAYETHTKRAWRGDRPGSFGSSSRSQVQSEEISMFFRVTEADCPVLGPAAARPARGLVHAVLPTKLHLPCSMHLQASWLLSVDRQDVQSLSDNAWNSCLYAQVPRLLAGLLKWLAAARFEDLETSYRLLPPLHFTVPAAGSASGTGPSSAGQQPSVVSSAAVGSRLCFSAFEQMLDVQELCDAVRREPVVPAWKAVGGADTCSLVYVPGESAIWLPPALVRCVPRALLHQWFGLLPFASDRLRDCAWHNLWASTLRKPTASMLGARRNYFALPPAARERVADRVRLGVVYLAAMYECMIGLPPVDRRAEAGQGQSGDRRAGSKSLPQGAATVSESLCGGLLPPLPLWPVFLTNRGAHAATAAEVVFLEPTLFTRELLEEDLYALLRSAATRVLTPPADKSACVAKVNMQHNRKNRYQEPKAPPQAPAHLLDEDLELVLTSGIWPEPEPEPEPASTSDESPSLSASERQALLVSARSCIEFARSSQPSRVVSVEQAAAALLAQWAGEYKGRALEDKLVPTVVKLLLFALKHNLPGAVSHVLVDRRKGGYNLLPVASTYISKALGHANLSELMKLQATVATTSPVAPTVALAVPSDGELNLSLPYVTTAYVVHPANAAKLTERHLKSLNSFLLLCGVQKGISLVASCRKPVPGEVAALPGGQLPKLRQTATSAVFVLPFNLGALTKKRPEVVDVDISPEWVAILQRAATSKALTTGHDNAALVIMLLRSADFAERVTADSTPYVTLLLKPPASSSGTAGDPPPVPSDADHRLPYDADNFPPPGFARLLFLPPGQAGAAILNLRPALWVSKLSSLKWVPAAPPGAAPSAPASMFLSPAEVVLDVESAAPVTVSGATIGDLMPTVRLPAAHVELLKGLPPSVQKVFAWGTVKPPPPIDRLKLLAADILADDSSVRSGDIRACSKDVCRQLCGLWRSICLAYRERRLGSADVQALRTLCNRPLPGVGSGLACLFPIPSLSPREEFLLAPLSRCVFVPSAGGGGWADETHAAVALAQVGYLVNVGAGAGDSSVGAGVETGALEEVLRVYAAFGEDLRSILVLPAKAPVDACAAYLTGVSEAARHHSSRSGSVHHPSLGERKAYSFSLWVMVRSMLINEGGDLRAPSETAVTAAGERLRKRLPDLHIYCRKGPGDSILTFPAVWRPVWGTTADTINNTPLVIPLLMDEGNIKAAGSGISMVNLLTHKHNFQPLGLLDFGDGSNRWQGGGAEGQVLAAADNVTVSVLGLSRLSDRKFFSLKARAVGKGDLQEALGAKLQAIELLVRLLTPRPTMASSAGTSGDSVARPPRPCPEIYRHASLEVVFKTPVYTGGRLSGHSETPINVYAMRGPFTTKPATQGSDSEIVGAVAGAVSSAPAPAPARVQCLLVTGESDDYAAELEEMLLAHYWHIGHSSTFGNSGSSSRIRKALLLLQHMEDEQKFLRMFSRYFAEFASDAALAAANFRPGVSRKRKVVDADMNAPPGEAETGAEGEALDDEDADEARSSEDFEEEARRRALAQIIGDMQGRRELAVQSAKRARGEQEKKQEQLSVQAEVPAPVGTAAVSARGAGRGVSILPSWMTTEELGAGVDASSRVNTNGGSGLGDGKEDSVPPPDSLAVQAPEVAGAAAPDQASAFLASMAEHMQVLGTGTGAETVEEAVAGAPRGAIGVGRGVSVLPAWMNGGGDVATVPPTVSLGQVADSDAAPIASYDASISGEAAAGRGVSVLPAWMTADAQPAAGVTVESGDDHPPAKRLKVQAGASESVYGPGTAVEPPSLFSLSDALPKKGLNGLQPLFLLVVGHFRALQDPSAAVLDTTVNRSAQSLIDYLSSFLGDEEVNTAASDLTKAIRNAARVLAEDLSRRCKNLQPSDPLMVAINFFLEKK